MSTAPLGIDLHRLALTGDGERLVENVAAPVTLRSRAKASRKQSLLAAAAELFAENGFNGVSIEELGSAVGVSGPAVYRHFAGKQAVLAALLVGVSEDLLEGGNAVIEDAADDEAALRSLIQFHVDFALTNPRVIRVQGRDLDSLVDPAKRKVRTLQRHYVELWVNVLGLLQPDVAPEVLRIRAHATFGLINSTPHSTRTQGGPTGSSPDDTVRGILEQMAWAALTAAAP